MVSIGGLIVNTCCGTALFMILFLLLTLNTLYHIKLEKAAYKEVVYNAVKYLLCGSCADL